MEYHDLVLSGKTVSKVISDGDSAYNTLVRNGAKLRISSGGYVEDTTVLNSTIISNAGSASGTTLSGGTMTLLNGGIATGISMLRNAKLTVLVGAVATDVSVGASGVVNATVRGGDEITRIEGVNELGSFYLSNGVAANFLLNNSGQLTISSGGTALDPVLNNTAQLTISSGGTATGIDQRVGGRVFYTVVRGGDTDTLVSGSNVSGTFLLSNGVASGFILYENAAQYVSSGGTALHTLVSSSWAHLYISSGGLAEDTSVCRASMTVFAGGIARDTTVMSGGSLMAAGGNISGATVSGLLLVTTATTGPDESSGKAALSDIFVAPEGVLDIAVNANFSGDITIRGKLAISGGVVVDTLSAGPGGSALVAGVFTLASGSSWNTVVAKGGKVNVSSGAVLVNLATVSGAQVDLSSGAVLAGTDFDIRENTVRCGGTALGMTGSGSAILDLGADGRDYDLIFGSGVTVSGAAVGSGGRIRALSGATVAGGAVAGGAVEILSGGSTVDTVVTGGGSLTLSAGAAADGAAIGSGGVMTLAENAAADNTSLGVGGSLALVSGASTGKRLFFDFSGSPSGGTVAGTVNDFALISSDTAICLVGTSDGGVYTVAPEGSTDLYVHCMPNGMYDNAIKAGESSVNAFVGMKHVFAADGKTISATSAAVAVLDSAAALDDSTAWQAGGRAAKWTNFTADKGSVIGVVSEAFDGDAWLAVEGTRLAGTTLYGAASGVDFSGVVNLLATSGTVLGNLAAGAAAGGSVGGVKFSVESATLGLSYAGGFGTVAGKTETLIAAGSMTKDFYAGALANYTKTHTVTSAGDISLTIENGRFFGNIYGAASVKAGADATSVVHSTGDVSLTIRDGSSLLGYKACIFAGGYATGSTADTTVYAVGDISAAIEGGSWGKTCGGRGVFGGVMVSGVAATAENVNLTISGGSMGNVHGGGWAQKGGASIVGDVNISISGGKVANVFGGGAHSGSGGTTSADNVTVTVSGGEISGDIFARGQLEGDVVTGDAEVIFTGGEGFDCGVWGYGSVGGGEDSDAVLSFGDYTGEFSGRIGGFGNVTLEGATAMTLATAAADVNVRQWVFDVSERDAALADTALLNWSDADFAAAAVTLNLAPGSTGEWTLVGAPAETAYRDFDVLLDGISILDDNIGLDEIIAAGDYAGWGFTNDNGLLKFKPLASV